MACVLVGSFSAARSLVLSARGLAATSAAVGVSGRRVRTTTRAGGRTARTAFFGTHLGGRLALLFAATYPERTRAVVAFASHPASMRDEDFPWGSSPEYRAQLLAALRDGSYDPSRLLARFRGREVKTTGDGFLATFDGPARAIRAAQAVRAELAEHGLQVRAGLHTGEVELVGGDIGGIAVHLAARVLAQATAGEILCSRTVKDLVAGAGFAFTDCGTHQLKGIPERWQIYAVQPAER